MPKDKYYVAGNSQEMPMGRKPAEKVHRGGAGSKRTIGLGTGMAGRAAKAIRKRKDYLKNL